MTDIIALPLILGNLRGWEWIIILVVILLLFGGKKIPELMRGLGRGAKSFKQGMKDAEREFRDAAKDDDATADAPKADASSEPKK